MGREHDRSGEWNGIPLYTTIQLCVPQINSMNRREVKTSQYTDFHHVKVTSSYVQFGLPRRYWCHAPLPALQELPVESVNSDRPIVRLEVDLGI